MNENPYEKRDDELGACWIKEGAKGEYMTGSVTIDGVKTDIVLFPNQYKQKENQPDWRILRSRPQGEKHTYAPSTRRDERERQPEPPRKPQAMPRPGPATWANAPRVASPRPAQRPQQADWTEDVPPVDDDDPSIPF